MDLLKLGTQSRKTGIKPRENLAKDKFDMEDIDEFFEDTTWLDSKQSGLSKSRKSTHMDITFTQQPSKKTLGVRRVYPSNLLERMNDIADDGITDSKSNDEQNFQIPGLPTDREISGGKEKVLHSGEYSYPESPPIDMDQDLEQFEPDHEIDSEHNHEIDNELDHEFNKNFDNNPENESDSEPQAQHDFEAFGNEQEHGTHKNKTLRKEIESRPPSSILDMSPNKTPKKAPKSASPVAYKASRLSKKMALGKSKRVTPKIAESDVDDIENLHSDDKFPEMNSSDGDNFSDSNYNTQESKFSTQGSTRSQQSSYKSSQDEYFTQPSPLPSPPPEGLRRSRRRKIAPLAYWRNERIVYSRADENAADPDSTLIRDIRKVPLQEIREVVHIPEQPEKHVVRAKKPKEKKRSKQETYDYESDPEIEGSEWFKSKSLETEVFEDEENKKRKVVAWAPDGGSFQSPPPSKSGQQVVENFRVAPLFDADSDMIAAGLLDFPFEGFKSLRTTGESSFIFHVAKGLIEVTLNSDKFVVTRGCSLEVPKYNIYSFRNIGQGTARLFFVQCQLGNS